jgi:hypothetical protein
MITAGKSTTGAIADVGELKSSQIGNWQSSIGNLLARANLQRIGHDLKSCG